MSRNIMFFHAMTGYDRISAFYMMRKKKRSRKFKRNSVLKLFKRNSRRLKFTTGHEDMASAEEAFLSEVSPGKSNYSLEQKVVLNVHKNNWLAISWDYI